jgi:LacI family transcriptional regulator
VSGVATAGWAESGLVRGGRFGDVGGVDLPLSRGQRRITMKEVAAVAGVHHTTVSLALRNHRSIPIETRTRIKGLAEKLGYRPNPLVSALMGSRCANSEVDRHTTLAYVVSSPPEIEWRKIPYFLGLFEGAQERAQELGYRLEVFEHTLGEVSAARLDRIFRARNVHGALIAPLPQGMSCMVLDWGALAAISLSLSLKEPFLGCVSNDQYLSGRLAYTKCREKGYRRIGFFMSEKTLVRLQHRWLAGFQLEQSLDGDGERVEPLIYDTPDTAQPPEDILKAWLLREQPDALICRLSDTATLSAPSLLKLAQKIGVAALDVEGRETPFAGVFQKPRYIGASGAELLVGKLHRNEFGPSPMTENHLVCGEWVEGPSLPHADQLRKRRLARVRV